MGDAPSLVYDDREGVRQMHTIAEPVENLIEIKRSRFIGNLYPIRSEEEAKERLREIRQQYPDATHHCYAYLLGEEQEVQKFSDDGEPSGTAGRPMLETLKKSGVTNVLAIVTRYFGGTLLGAGGLVRAYSQCVAELVKAATLQEIIHYTALEVEVGYADWNRLQHLLEKQGVQYDTPAFAEQVRLAVRLPQEEAAAFEAHLREMTHGQVRVRRVENE